MNICWTIAGGMALAGALAHVVLGEAWILARLDPATLPHHPGGPGDTSKRYLRWFWHVGTIDIAGTGIGGVVIGVWDVVGDEVLVARLLALLFAGMFGAFCLVAVPRPIHFLRIPQGILMLIVAALLWLGTRP